MRVNLLWNTSHVGTLEIAGLPESPRAGLVLTLKLERADKSLVLVFPISHETGGTTIDLAHPVAAEVPTFRADLDRPGLHGHIHADLDGHGLYGYIRASLDGHVLHGRLRADLDGSFLQGRLRADLDSHDEYLRVDFFGPALSGAFQLRSGETEAGAWPFALIALRNYFAQPSGARGNSSFTLSLTHADWTLEPDDDEITGASLVGERQASGLGAASELSRRAPAPHDHDTGASGMPTSMPMRRAAAPGTLVKLSSPFVLAAVAIRKTARRISEAVTDAFQRSLSAAPAPTPPSLPENHEVLISHQTPTTIRPGASFPLEIILHLSTIEPLPPEGVKVEEAATIQIASGKELLITLSPPKGFEIDEPDGVIVWTPPRARLQFMLTAPATIKQGDYYAKARIRTIGDPSVEINRFYIHLRVSRHPAQTALGIKLRTVKRLPRTAFASYSRKDTATVMHRVAALTSIGIDVFVDCLDIREGADWADALNSHTISKDTFLLFWSRNASASTWVDREWRHALRERGLSYITPNALETPDVSPPPTELASLQFGSVPLLLARSTEKPAAPPSTP